VLSAADTPGGRLSMCVIVWRHLVVVEEELYMSSLEDAHHIRGGYLMSLSASSWSLDTTRYNYSLPAVAYPAARVKLLRHRWGPLNLKLGYMFVTVRLSKTFAQHKHKLEGAQRVHISTKLHCLYVQTETLNFTFAWLLSLWQHNVITSPRVTACYCDEAKTSETVLHFCTFLLNPHFDLEPGYIIRKPMKHRF